MKNRGFTLIELMLVVLIIGLVYGLASNNMKRFNDKTEIVDLLNLPDFVASQQDHDHLSVICIDRCKECALYRGEKMLKELTPFVDEKAEYFHFDRHLLTREVQWLPLFRENGVEEPICFRYDLYSDGSSSEMIIKTKEMVLDYPGYFGTVGRYTSVEEVVDAKQALIEEVLQ